MRFATRVIVGLAVCCLLASPGVVLGDCTVCTSNDVGCSVCTPANNGWWADCQDGYCLCGQFRCTPYCGTEHCYLI